MEVSGVLAKEREEEKRKQEELISKARRNEKISMVIPFLGIVFIVIFFAIVTKGNTLTASNLNNIMNQSFNIIIVAVGAVFVYSHGGMDMSVGAVQGLASVVVASLILKGAIPEWMVLPISILVGLAAGFMTGAIHVTIGVPAFVVSLCMRYIATGITRTATSAKDLYIPYNNFSFWNNGFLKLMVLLLVIVISYIAFEYTRIGKYLKAIGGNKTTAFQSGINVKKYIVLAYMILGSTVGLVAFFGLTRTGVVSSSTGQGFELDILTAIVLGGFPLSGGAKSKIRSAILGAITVAVLTNGLVLWGVDPNIIGGIKGVLFLIIVYISYERKKGEIVS